MRLVKNFFIAGRTYYGTYYDGEKPPELPGVEWFTIPSSLYVGIEDSRASMSRMRLALVPDELLDSLPYNYYVDPRFDNVVGLHIEMDKVRVVCQRREGMIIVDY